MPVVAGLDASAEPVLECEEIQGHILPGFGNQPTELLGVRRRLPAEGEGGELGAAALRRWLRDLAPRVTPLGHAMAMREERRNEVMASGVMPKMADVRFGVALSAEALPALGLAMDRIREAAFLRGMAGANLGHTFDATGKPDGWLVGASRELTPEVLLIVGCDDEEELKRALECLQRELPPELEVTFRQCGAPLEGEREHFGFRDGISQPGVRGRLSEDPSDVLTRRYFSPDDPRAAYESRPGQPLIWPGQFVFGYPTQVDLDPSVPGPMATPPHPWMRNGSFLAFQRLRQDVAAFKGFANAEAARVSQVLGREVSPQELEAWLVGRWPDGSPLVRAPAAPDPELAADKLAINFFGYAGAEPDAKVLEGGMEKLVAGSEGDNAGHRCPHFAHVRKVNTRDKGTDLGSSTRFRILRRGVPYGEPYQEGEDPAVDRGLIFLSYQRSLHPQFLTLFATWMNKSDAPEGFGHDLLMGRSPNERSAERFFADGSSCTLRAPNANPWIISTGGGFFFTPAISVFRDLPD